jgi:hypothetical protein
MYADRIESPYIISTEGSIIYKANNSEIIIDPLHVPSGEVRIEPVNPNLDRILDLNEEFIK